jgi:hypothetical protein
MFKRKIDAAIVYGDDATDVRVASNGPDGNGIGGAGPPKLIYLL